jgi:hypothetical protein
MLAIGAVPPWNWALQIVGMLTAYAGAELNARLKVSGFYIWMFSNVTLAALHAATGLWILLLLDVLFFRVNVIGVMRWKRNRTEQDLRFPRGARIDDHEVVDQLNV